MPDQSSTSQLRRLMEGTLFVAVWMVVGFVFKLDATTYLLVGIPITIVFQKFVAKQPLRALWVRIAPSLKFNTLKHGALAIVDVFAFLNLWLFILFISMENWEASLYELVAILGSIPLAYSLSCFSKATFRPLIMCFATAGAIGAWSFIFRYWLNAYYYHSQTPVTVESFLIVAVVSLIEYVPVVFLLEEVWFRGAFDSHVYHVGEQRSDLTALYVSLIWGRLAFSHNIPAL